MSQYSSTVEKVDTGGSVGAGIIFIAVVGRHMAGVMKTDDDTTDNLTRDNKAITESHR